jgi:hypothetical protein
MKTEQVTKRSRAHTTYTLQDGTVVPGVTTILGVLNKPALVKWANNLGLQGIDSTKFVDEKAAIGTLAHQMIADYLRGAETDMSEYSKVQIDQAENATLSFFEWEKTHKVEPTLIEEPMVSEVYRFGGTIDCLGKINGNLSLLDFKTSSGIFPEMMVQVVAYRQLLVEHGYKIDQTTILRVGRTADEGFEEHLVNEVDKRWQIFQHCLEIYRLQKEVKNG